MIRGTTNIKLNIKEALQTKHHSSGMLQQLYISDVKWQKEVLSTVVTALQIDPFGVESFGSEIRNEHRQTIYKCQWQLLFLNTTVVPCISCNLPYTVPHNSGWFQTQCAGLSTDATTHFTAVLFNYSGPLFQSFQIIPIHCYSFGRIYLSWSAVIRWNNDLIEYDAMNPENLFVAKLIP